jgi:hypothetical protein
MDVAIHEARRHVAASGIDNGGLLANAVLGRVATNAQVRNAPCGNGDVCVLKDLVRGDAYQPGVTNDKVSGLLALCHADERTVAFPQWTLAKAIEHDSPSRRPTFKLSKRYQPCVAVQQQFCERWAKVCSVCRLFARKFADRTPESLTNRKLQDGGRGETNVQIPIG